MRRALCDGLREFGLQNGVGMGAAFSEDAELFWGLEQRLQYNKRRFAGYGRAGKLQSYNLMIPTAFTLLDLGQASFVGIVPR